MAWRLQASDVSYTSPDVDAANLFSSASQPLLLPPTAASSGPFNQHLPLHGSVAVQTAPSAGRQGGASTPTPVDILMYTGGLIWCTEFSPSLPQQTGEESGLLAAAVHPQQCSRNKTGAALHGLGAVQLWSLLPAAHMPLGLSHDGRVTWDVKWCPHPELLLQQPIATAASISNGGVGGRGGGIPTPSAPGATAEGASAEPSANAAASSRAQEALPIVGVLAMVLGDGSVEVVAVPQPSAVHALLSAQVSAHQRAAATAAAAAAAPTAEDDAADHAAEHGIADDATDAGMRDTNLPGHRNLPEAAAAIAPSVYVRVRPAIRLSRQQLFGSLPTCCVWSPTPSHCNILLVGGYDGSVSKWRLPIQPLDRLQVLFHVRCDLLPLRRLMFQPPEDLTCHDQCKEHMFATAGSSGRVSVWDMRDMSGPVMEKMVARVGLCDGVWVREPWGIMTGMEDGSLRFVIMDFLTLSVDKERSHTYKGAAQNCTWSVAYSQEVQAVAYCGEDGIIGLMWWERLLDMRKRRPHIALGGLAREGNAMRVLVPEECVMHPAVYGGGIYFLAEMEGKRKEATKPDPSKLVDESLALHTIAFSPNVVNGVVWLASGGAAGLLRCQRICVQGV